MTLICGVNPVLEALAAGTRHFDRLLVVKGLHGRRLAEAIRRATRLSIPLRFEMRDTLDRLAGGVPHQGIIAVVSEKPLLSLEDLLEATREPALIVVLDGIEDPRNLGAILRTAEAAGADGVVLPERHSAGLSETVARASAGAVEHVKVARVGNLVQALEALKARGIWVVGYDAAGSERWDAVDLGKPVALVLGGEGRGIRRLVREHCDHLVSIPHFGHVSSLNVSVAAGVALYEAVRQRRAVPSPVRPIPLRPHSRQVIGPGPDEADEPEDLRDPAADAAEGGGAGEEGPEAEGYVLPHLDFHDEVAWGQGPTVLKPVEFRHLHRPGRRGKPGRGRHEGRGRRSNSDDGQAPAPAPEGGGSGSASAEARGDHQGRRQGRRRHRGRRDGPPAAGQPPATGPAEPPPGAQNSPPGPEASANGGDGAQRRRRGRRRRRR